MVRLVLTDHQWSLIEPHCLGKKAITVAVAKTTVYLLKLSYGKRSPTVLHGFYWQDLPEIFGRWNTVVKRFDDWSREGCI